MKFLDELEIVIRATKQDFDFHIAPECIKRT